MVGGPAFGAGGRIFKPGLYVKHGVTFTSRGCPNKCRFCLVPALEGKIQVLPIRSGNIVQDNNLLACPQGHLNQVFKMLKTQKKYNYPAVLNRAE